MSRINKFVLYRYFDKNDQLLYIGITQDFKKRNFAHSTGYNFSVRRLIRLKKIYSTEEAENLSKGLYQKLVCKYKLEEYETRESVLKAEALAIKNEKPLLNVVFNG